MFVFRRDKGWSTNDFKSQLVRLNRWNFNRYA